MDTLKIEHVTGELGGDHIISEECNAVTTNVTSHSIMQSSLSPGSVVNGDGEETITTNGTVSMELDGTEEEHHQHQHCATVSHDMNGQLEIEIPAGESREGAIHTIQLQSPGGNTHIVEGLVVTSAGGIGTGEDGETTAIFHPATTGAFILPTSHSHSNHLAGTTLVTTSSASPTSCEVITADASEHHILSGLQVVRVASGENGETIFLVPSSAAGGDKDAMQQVMVLQSASSEELGEDGDPVHHVTHEIVEESVEINIPSPKPVLTTVKQESVGNKVNNASTNGEETRLVVAVLEDNGSDEVTLQNNQHQQQNPSTAHINNTTTLVVVSEAMDNTATNSEAVSTPSVVTKVSAAVNSIAATDTANAAIPSTSAATNPEKPIAETKPTPTKRTPARAPITTNGPSIADDRPKRKAAIKATATRQAALAIASPRKRSLSPKVAAAPKGTKIKVVETKATTPAQNPLPITPPTPIFLKGKGSSSSRMVTPIISSVTGSVGPSTSRSVIASATPSTSGGVIGSGGRILFGLPPPPPVVLPTVKSSKGGVKVFVGGKPLYTPPKNSLDLLPEDLVSDSDEEADGSPVRKCIVCLRRKRFTEDVFEGGQQPIGSPRHQPRLLESMEVLLRHLNIPLRGKGHEVGLCFSCVNHLQRWHIFKCAVIKRHEEAKPPGLCFDKDPLHLDVFETRIYRNCKKMMKVKEVYRSATHSHYARRHLTDKDWDYFCQQLYRFNSSRAERTKELEKHLTCREKLSHIYCIKCQRLIRNGKKGFVKHMRTHHPHQQVLFPCDICGNHFPEKGIAAEEFYSHWLTHFYFNACEECGKRFPTKRSLAQHRQSVHKNSNRGTTSWAGEANDQHRPWKCDQCDATFKMKAALVSHRDVVHLNQKNHVCNICGEAFKSASSLRGHVRRHEGRRDYKCEVCDKEYYTYSALKGHKVVHQTARDFVCAICGKAFKKKKALEEHGTLHTGVKPHRCNICGREIRVKSNLYKHMKIHKKNAELGITSGRGRNLGIGRSSNASSSAGSSSSTSVPIPSTSTATSATIISATPQQQQHTQHHTIIQTGDKTNLITTSPSMPIPIGRIKMEPKIKQIKVEDRILEIKQEQPTLITHFQPSSSGLSNSSTATITNASGLATSTSPMQGTTAVECLVENADIGNGEHRAPIVVSIVTDGLSGGPASILQMDPEQQAQLLSAVTSFANSHNLTGGSGPTFLTTSHLQAAVSSGAGGGGTTNVVNTANSSGSGQDPILGVATTQFYNTQQFFTSLDQLQH